MKLIIISVVVLVTLSGCAAQRETLGAAIDYRHADWPSDRVVLDVPYRNGPDFDDAKHRLDLFLPEAGRTDWPTLVFVHGGGWTHGDRRLGALNIRPMRNLGRFYAARGYGVVVPSYRLQPNVDWRTQIDDVAAAVAWARSAVAEYGGDPDAIFLGGHSAGAWLAARVGFTEAPLARHGLDRDGICGLVLVSGSGYDLADVSTTERDSTRRYFERRFGGDEDWQRRASVVTNVESPSPPALVMNAEGEGPGFDRQAELLYGALSRVSPRSRRRVIPGQNHQRILVSMSLEGDPVSEAALEFLDGERCAETTRARPGH